MSNLTTTNHYRRDIQAIRGIAVLMVVAYHSKLDVPGGFTGVDVFFVVSGYVITQHIVDRYRQSRFSFREFFEKRILRLIPLLAVVNAVTVLVALVVLNPFGEIQQVTEAIRYSNFFGANLYFFLSDDYLALENHPLRHLWSLGVEEQFYLLFPFLLIGIMSLTKRIGKAVLWFLFVGLVVISLSLCLYLTEFQDNSRLMRLAFFGTPFRSWQFLSGTLVFFLVKFGIYPKKRSYFNTINAIGLALICYSAFTISTAYSYPNFHSLIPVLGTCLLIVSGLQRSFVSSIYTNVIFERLGDVSYGWYLWHWPFIVFAEKAFSPRPYVLVLASVASLLVSIATYRLIEKPIRYSTRLLGRKAWGVLAFCIAASFVVVFAVDRAADSGLGLYKEKEDDVLLALSNCYSIGRNGQFPDICDNGVREDARPILLLGDSQAQSAADGLYEAGASMGIRVLGFGAGGCPMRSASTLRESAWCPEAQDFYLSAVGSHQPALVVIANRYDDYVIKGSDPMTPDIRIPFENGQIPENKEEQIKSIVDSLFSMVEEVRDFGVGVVILLDTPNAVMPSSSVLSKLRGPTQKEIEKVVSANMVRDEINSLIRLRFANMNLVEIVDPQTSLCSDYPMCFSMNQGRYLYWEQQHLNRQGSLQLVPLWKSIISDRYKGE